MSVSQFRNKPGHSVVAEITGLSVLPPFSSVDTGDSGALRGYGHLLFSIFKIEGGFSYDTPSPLLRKVRNEAAKWIDHIENNIEGKNAREIQDYASMYKVVHHLAFSKAPDGFRYNRWLETGLLGMAQGQKADKVFFMSWVLDNLKKDHTKVPDNIYKWYTSVLRHWNENLEEKAKVFRSMTEQDSLRVINFLIEELFSYPIEKPSKKELLLERGLSLLNEINSRDTAADEELVDGSNFCLALPLCFPEVDCDEIRNNLQLRLSVSPTLPSVSRLAYRLDLEYESTTRI